MGIMQQNSQYTKFEYREFGNVLGHDTIVAAPSTHKNDADKEKDRIVTEAIVDHFSSSLDSLEEEQQNDTQPIPPPPPPPPAPIIDIESIKAESYKMGYNDAEAALLPALEKIKDDEAFNFLLKNKLESITSSINFEDQVFKLLSNLLVIIAKKLHLMVPADFESLILGEMVPLLNKYYKIGSITLNVNPDRVDYCNNLFRIGSLPQRISENIIVVADDSIAKDNCNIKWNDTVLEYNQEELSLDVENILEHIKIEINN